MRTCTIGDCVTCPRNAPNRRIKIRYMTQLKARPPLFVFFGNQLDELPESYKRFLMNGLREMFDFHGVPMRLSKRSPKNPFAGKARRKN